MAATNRSLLIAGAAILIIAAAAYTFTRPPIDSPGTSNLGGSGSSTPSTNTPPPTTTTTTNSSKHGKGEMLYKFDVPLKVFEYEHVYEREGYPKETIYNLQGYISWAPENPYLRYYEVTVNFKGNNLHAQNSYASGDFQLWGNAAHPYIPYLRKESDIVALGPEEIVGIYKIYGGGFQASRTWWDKKPDGTEVWGPDVWPDAMHGWKCFGIHANFNSTTTDPVTVGEMEAIKAEMRQWITEYTKGWTYAVRAMS